MAHRYRDPPDRFELIDVPDDDIEYAEQEPYGGGYAPPPGSYIPDSRQIAPPAPVNVRPAGEVRPHRALCVARRPDSLAAQQYRLLRFKLKEGLDPRVIGITSPAPGEGKTTAAANLGLALAEGRQVRIMLLDLNLRAPALIDMFGVQSNAGVAEQLHRKRRDIEAYWDILELGTRLHLMAGGGRVENPARLLSAGELSHLLYDLAEMYDYVVVDLPAVLQGADVKTVQEMLDGIILVCRAATTTRSAVNAAVSQLGERRIHGLLMLDVVDRNMPK